MNKLEMWNACTVLRKPRDILAGFLFALFLCQPLIQQACLWTDKTGVHFHTLPGGRYCCERACESGKGVWGGWGVGVGGCMYACMVWWKKCGRSQARYDSGKTIKSKKGWSSGINSLTVFLWVFLGAFFNLVLNFVLFFFLFVHPPAFCSFLLPLKGSHLSSLIVKTPAFQWLSCTLAGL